MEPNISRDRWALPTIPAQPVNRLQEKANFGSWEVTSRVISTPSKVRSSYRFRAQEGSRGSRCINEDPDQPVAGSLVTELCQNRRSLGMPQGLSWGEFWGAKMKK